MLVSWKIILISIRAPAPLTSSHSGLFSICQLCIHKSVINFVFSKQVLTQLCHVPAHKLLTVPAIVRPSEFMAHPPAQTERQHFYLTLDPACLADLVAAHHVWCRCCIRLCLPSFVSSYLHFMIIILLLLLLF